VLTAAVVDGDLVVRVEWTGDGDAVAGPTTLRLDGTTLSAAGPVRDLLVVAGGRHVCRVRGGDLTVDLGASKDIADLTSAHEDRRWYRPELLEEAVRSDESSGLRHRYELDPDPPVPGQPTVAWVDGDGITSGALVYTTDGRDPFAGDAVPLERVGDRWRATIPAQPAGRLLRYAIEVEMRDGVAVVADAAPDFVYPLPKVPFVRPRRHRFSAVVGAPPAPEWFGRAVVYHLLVDRFAGPGGRPLPSQVPPLLGFAGGSIDGITTRLDDIVATGADTLLVSPIVAGDMHVTYDVRDHFAVDDRLGTEADARRLCDAAHGRGLRVLLDFEASYLGGQHPTVLAARRDPDGPSRRWFHGEGNRLFGWYGGNPTFAPLDHDHPQAREHVIDAARFWLDIGFDGFRLDSAHAASFDFWTHFGRAVAAHRPDAVTFAEATKPWPFCQRYRGRLSGFLDFDLAHALRSFASGNGRSAAPTDLAAALAQRGALAPGFEALAFVESHDADRLSFLAGGDERRVDFGLALLLCLPGPVVLYYGTEVGLGQTAAGDCDLVARPPMPWGADQPDPGRRQWLRERVELRRDLPALASRHVEVLAADDASGIIVFVRGGPADEPVLVAANAGGRPATAGFEWRDRAHAIDLAPLEVAVLAADLSPVAAARRPRAMEVG
jgi:glycosidase